MNLNRTDAELYVLIFQFDDFVLDHPAIRSSYADAYKNMRYRIQANIRWRTLNEAKITDWLNQARERQTNK